MDIDTPARDVVSLGLTGDDCSDGYVDQFGDADKAPKRQKVQHASNLFQALVSKKPWVLRSVIKGALRLVQCTP